MITGASDGIGKEYSIQLARAGFNVVLVSRTASKLAALESELKDANPAVETLSLAMDFAEDNAEDYTRLAALIKDLDIAVLVNNVGLSHDIPVPFAQTPETEMRNIITINCLGTLKVTRMVVPGMQTRKRGLILTMGSFGGLTPTPLLATYSGSKAFLQQWSSALGEELKPYKITVELVQSYLVTSAMSKIRRASATIPTPKVFVKAVLSKIGKSGGSGSYVHTSSPYWAHGLMAWGIIELLGPMGGVVAHFNNKMHQSIRQRALRKAEREGKKKA